MLQVTIPAAELWDEQNQKFIITEERTLQLEHSLVSLSKWESKWCVPFMSTKNLTVEQTVDYIRCMTLTQNVPPDTYKAIPNSVIDQVTEYINAPMTATWFSDEKKQKPNREVVTSELIYYWMIALQIPVKFEKWHLNRLMTLIKVCSLKNEPPKKSSKRSTMSRNSALNAARRQRLGSRG